MWCKSLKSKNVTVEKLKTFLIQWLRLKVKNFELLILVIDLLLHCKVALAITTDLNSYH